MPHFTIIIPTVRDRKQTAPAIARCWETCTQPTDLHVCDGRKGKVYATNEAIHEYLKYKSDDLKEYWVVADDDFAFPKNWQEKTLEAFAEIPKLGGLGFCFQDCPEYRAYCAQWPEFKYTEHVAYQPLSHGNIVGACIISPLHVAGTVGLYKTVDGAYYDYTEDGYRCFRIRQQGLSLAYAKCEEDAFIFPYADTPEYLAMKQHDIALIKETGIAWLPK